MPEDPDLHRVMADIAILRDGNVLLIQRRYEPFKDRWCLPGGHVDKGEQVADAAVREAEEETGLAIELDHLLGVYDTPGRDPRGPTISIAYAAHPTTPAAEPAAATDAREAAWFPLDDLPALGFDHATILSDLKAER